MIKKTKIKISIAALMTAMTITAPTMVRADDGTDGWQMKNKVDEETRVREGVGLSKARTLGQSEMDKTVNPNWGGIETLRFHTTLRASYDAVYELNSGRFGEGAGNAITLQNNNGTPTAWGQGIGHADANGGALPGITAVRGGALGVALPGAQLGFSLANNPNQGLALVDSFQGQDTGIALATPVRPCNIDKRGCMPGYMDKSSFELMAPEFNNRLDFLREAYVDAELPVGSSTLALRFGRQQLVWGRTDLFRVLDVVNPMDYSRNNIYDENSDIRIPMGMLRADYRMGARGPFDDLNIQGVWDWEKWRPNDLGQAGSPNNPLGAAQLFRALKNCWDNGCTVANFANGNAGTDFGPRQIGIRNVNLPDWNLSNTTVGGKVEGELKGVGFSLNALTYRSQMPSLHGARVSTNSFTGATGAYPYMIAFDMEFPRINLYGGSLDFNIEPIDTAFRMEVAYTQGEHFADTAVSDLWKASDVVRYVVGADRNTFIPFLNEHRAFLLSTQTFGQHLNAYDLHNTANGTVGIPDFQDNWTTTFLMKGWYNADTLSPQVVYARDWMARSNVIEPSIEWQPSNLWRFRLGSNIKFGSFHHAFDNDSSQNPYLGGANNGNYISAVTNMGGAWGAEPLGRFKTGILGMAHNENELFANATVRF
jgi:hypothetical protein